MAFSSSTLFLPSLPLGRKLRVGNRLYGGGATHNSIPLQIRRSSVKDKDGLHPVEHELADATEKAQNMRVRKDLTVFGSHRRLKLVYPDTRIYGHGLALHGLQPGTSSEPQKGAGRDSRT